MDIFSPERLLFARISPSRFFRWAAIGLLGSGPISFLIIDYASGTVWALSVMAGLAVACTTHRQWWPELPKNAQLKVWLSLLCLYLGISIFNGLLVDNSHFALHRLERQLLLAGIPFVFLLLWWLRLRLQTVLVLLSVNAWAFGLYSFWFFWANSGRVHGATHAIHFGNTGLLLAFSSLALLPIAHNRGQKFLAVSGMALGCVASVLSGARGGWIATPFLFVITMIMLKRALCLKRSVLLGMTVLTVLFLIGLCHMQDVQKRIARVTTDLNHLSRHDFNNSVGRRFLMWKQAWLEIKEAPLLGTGFSGYRHRMLEAIQSGVLPKHMFRLVTEPHNEYLYQWATRGLVGLSTYLAGLFGIGWYFSRLMLDNDIIGIAIAQVGLSTFSVVAIGGLTITVIDQRDVIRFLGWIMAILMYSVWLYNCKDSNDHSEEV